MSELPLFVTISKKAYRFLLKAYPEPFRSEFGEEMSDVFSCLLVDAMQKKGRLGVAATWFHVVADYCSSVAYEHSLILRERRAMLRSTTRLIGSAALAVLAVVAAVIWATQSNNVGNLESPALVSWQGIRDDFPAGATIGAAREFSFVGQEGGTVTLIVPTLTWKHPPPGEEK